mmetsp:Transcript_15231/g.48519  ORF Transcript_15231/g.48519 Transcript_15231/m.48519 type:complete len:302 (-) Transcript_15231:1734-2639(-)
MRIEPRGGDASGLGDARGHGQRPTLRSWCRATAHGFPFFHFLDLLQAELAHARGRSSCSASPSWLFLRLATLLFLFHLVLLQEQLLLEFVLLLLLLLQEELLLALLLELLLTNSLLLSCTLALTLRLLGSSALCLETSDLLLLAQLLKTKLFLLALTLLFLLLLLLPLLLHGKFEALSGFFFTECQRSSLFQSLLLFLSLQLLLCCMLLMLLLHLHLVLLLQDRVDSRPKTALREDLLRLRQEHGPLQRQHLLFPIRFGCEGLPSINKPLPEGNEWLAALPTADHELLVKIAMLEPFAHLF